MHTLRKGLALLLALGIVVFAGSAAAQAPEGKVNLEKIKYASLGKLIRGLKGKVILVDFWAEY